MGSYYSFVPGIDPKFPAYSRDIDHIQSNIERAFQNMLNNNEGDAYVLGSNDESFELTPIDNSVGYIADGKSSQYIDQEQLEINTWFDIKSLYVRQTIKIERSSINKLTLWMKNTSGSDVPVTVEIRNDEDNALLDTSTVVIPASTTAEGIDFTFALHHLHMDNYYIVVKKTSTASSAIYIGYKNQTKYNGSCCSSADGLNWNDPVGDLYFKQEFADYKTFDVQRGVAIINGNYLANTDTHVIMPGSDPYGDRIDLVVMNDSGIFSVIQGKAAKKPVAPVRPWGSLAIAYITVKKNSGAASTRILDQELQFGHTRPRQVLRRLRLIEQDIAWLREFNTPQRFKYYLSGHNLFDENASVNAYYDEDLGAWRIGVSKKIIRFNSKSTLGITKSQITQGLISGNCTIESHTTRTWNQNPKTGQYYWDATKWFDYGWLGYEGKNRATYWNEHSIFVDKDRKDSHFPGAIFQPEESGTLLGINTQFGGNPANWAYNIKQVQMKVFEIDHDMHPIRLVDASDVKTPNQFDLTGNYGTRFVFDGNKELDEDKAYGWILVFSANNRGLGRCSIKFHTWNIVPENTEDKRRRNNTFIVYKGASPPYIPQTSSSSKNGAIVPATKLHQGIGFALQLQSKVYHTKGIIQSSAITAPADISAVRVNLNLKMAENTSYSLEVSNDGGATYHRIPSSSLKFPAHGTQFRWRLTLMTNDDEKTPILYYDSADGYAIQFTLLFHEGSPTTSGQFVTIPFKGDAVANYALGYTSSFAQYDGDVFRDIFSHWEWFRFWVEENEGTIRVSIEGANSEDEGGSPIQWNTIRSGLALSDFVKTPVDYGGVTDVDEYNYHSESDPDAYNDMIIIDNCETAWTKGQENVTVTAVSSNPAPYEGTKSVKMAITASTGIGTLAYVVKEMGLTDYEAINLFVYTDTASEAGDYKLVLSKSTDFNTDDILEVHDFPALSADNWHPIGFSLTDPDELADVRVVAIFAGVEPTATVNLNIDQLYASYRENRIIDTFDSGWSSAQGANVAVSADTSEKVSGVASLKIVLGAGATSGLVAKKGIRQMNLSTSNQIRFWFHSNIATVGSSQISIGFYGDTACTDLLQSYSLPTLVDSDVLWQRIVIDLENKSQINAVKGVGILQNTDLGEKTLYFDLLEAQESTDMPFYHKWVRFRFNVSVTNDDDESPIIKKIGLIGQLI